MVIIENVTGLGRTVFVSCSSNFQLTIQLPVVLADQSMFDVLFELNGFKKNHSMMAMIIDAIWWFVNDDWW